MAPRCRDAYVGEMPDAAADHRQAFSPEALGFQIGSPAETAEPAASRHDAVRGQ